MSYSIPFLYPYTLLEGQGMGTAYEYYSKLRVIDAVFARVGTPRSMVVLGLPEKHGYDLDFVLLAHRLHCPLWVYDDRPDVLAAFHEALQQLPDPAMREQVGVGRIDTLIDRPGPAGHRFHWLVSTASVQRLADEQIVAYIRHARSVADRAFLFIPNSGNRAHLTLSGMRGLVLGQVLDLCRQAAQAGATRAPGVSPPPDDLYPQVTAAGHCDIAPFPPGLQRSTEAKEKAMHSPVETLAMRGLEWWCRGEAWLPNALQKRWAHLVYVALDLGGSTA